MSYLIIKEGGQYPRHLGWLLLLLLIISIVVVETTKMPLIGTIMLVIGCPLVTILADELDK